MQLRIISVFVVTLCLCLSTIGQSLSCLDRFEDFETLEPEVNLPTRNQDYLPTMAWYGDCMVVGSSSGLWLFDPNQPARSIQLVSIKDQAINHVAVNPQTYAIAFSFAQEPIVYLIESNKGLSTVMAEGQVVTAISFSPDGSLMAMTSSDTVEGFIFNARIQVWDLENSIESTILSEVSIISEVFFSKDNLHLLTHDVEPGYFGDEITQWDTNTTLPVWNYEDLLNSLQPWSVDNSLAITTVAMQDDIIALGGIDGYYNDHNFYGFGVHFWDSQTKQLVTKIRVKDRYDEEDIYTLPYLVIAFDSSKSILATSLEDNTVKIWDIETGQQSDEFTVQSPPIQRFLFNPSTPLLAVLSGDGIITIFDIELMTEIMSFQILR